MIQVSISQEITCVYTHMVSDLLTLGLLYEKKLGSCVHDSSLKIFKVVVWYIKMFHVKHYRIVWNITNDIDVFLFINVSRETFIVVEKSYTDFATLFFLHRNCSDFSILYSIFVFADI